MHRLLMVAVVVIGVPVVAYLLLGRGHSAMSVDDVIKSSWATATPEWQARLSQDETQRVCSQYRNAPPPGLADAILASGYGGRFTDYPPRTANGGNCYACHQMDGKELSFGTLGPSLREYGKIRKYGADDVKAVYERIYNPHATIPCANMPRMGTSGFLTIDQIKDLVAFVMSPESPVNK